MGRQRARSEETGLLSHAAGRTNYGPVHVSFLIGSLEVGGAETQLVRLANALDRTHYRPSIVCLWKGGDLERMVAKDVPVTMAGLARISGQSGANRGIFAARIMASLVRSLRRERPDIVHAYLPAAYILGGVAAWTLRVPLIIASRRGLTSFQTIGSGAWLARMANRVIDMNICNSKAVQDWAIAKEGISRDKTVVVHNGIDLPPATGAPQLPEDWGRAGMRAGMIANLIQYKGHPYVLQALAEVVRTHPEFRLVLIGDGPERQSLVRLVAELGIAVNVRFAGRITDAQAFMPAFDFTILASSEEGFPNALMESMAHAVPVVATNVGGVAELVRDGVQGRLVPYGEPAQLASAISWMIEHPEERREMGFLARERIRTEFSTGRMVDETEAIYQQLLARHRLAPRAV